MMNIKGSLVALVTPMEIDGSVDWAALKNLVDWHVESGTAAIVSVGTTGESATLSPEEHMEVVGKTIGYAAGRIPVIAGTGGNATSEAIHLTKAAADLGADACLLVVPYYNRPGQAGMYAHFRKIAETVDVPQILYNVPGRTVADLSNETALKLAEIDNIVGIKDATGDVPRGIELIKAAPEDFVVYSGDDPTACELIGAGAWGDISVTANVAPAAMAEMTAAALTGDMARAETINGGLASLHTDLFIEASPAPTKWVLSQMGKTGPSVRLPIVQISDASKPVLQRAMQAADISLPG